MSTPTLPTEHVGSLPRPSRLQQVVLDADIGAASAADLERERDAAVVDTIRRLEQTGSPLVNDGEQRRLSFASYPLATDEVTAGPVFAVYTDGHHRVIPSIAHAPFRFHAWAAEDVAAARKLTDKPLKQAVVSPSMLSLMVGPDGIGDYSREDFLEDVVAGCAQDIRQCFEAGAQRVSIDFTEGRLALRPTALPTTLTGTLAGTVGGVSFPGAPNVVDVPWAGPDSLPLFIDLLNRVLDRVPDDYRANVGVHTCSGNDHDAHYSGGVDYAELLPELFAIDAGYFMIEAAGEDNPDDVARQVGRQLARWDTATRPRRPQVLLGVTSTITPKLESAQEVCDQLVRAARYIPADLLGSTDDCGFSPYLVDQKPRHGSPDFARDVAFAKIAARVRGTAMAADILSGGAS